MKSPTLSQRCSPGARSTLSVALIAALCIAQAATAAPSVGPVGAPTALSRGDAVLGALPMQQPMHVVVALKLRNKDALDAFVARSVASQAKGHAMAPMTSAQALANHMPTREQAQAVASYLTSMGFTHVKISQNRLLVTADGTAGAAGRAFQTSFRQIRTHDGRIAYANIDSVRVPAALGGTVQSVLGLQNVYQLHTFALRSKALHATTRKAARAMASVHPLYTNYYFPEEFTTIYGADSLATPSNVIAGIISEGDLTQTLADLNSFTDDAGFPRLTTYIVNIDGTSSDTSGVVEWDLDSQTIAGSAFGELQQLNFYNMVDMTNGSLVDAFNQAVSDNEAKVVNVSLGECETGAQGDGGADAADAIFEIGVAQGQTFSISTGDSGADECPTDGLSTKIPSWPANSQYVVAVAGTNLDAGSPSTLPKAWSSETVWTGSGGSASLYEPKPSWQTLWAGGHRGVADVAFDADPNTGAAIYISSSGGYAIVGGTSLAAPIFSGMWSRVLQHNPTIGFAGPVIYSLQDADFHDITSGSNGISAKVGYDLASGRGSMIVSSAVADIDANSLGNQPPVASFSPVSTGLTTRFTDHSTDVDGNIASYAWDFGDGTTGTDANPTHAYAADGTYTVIETVTDQVGASSYASLPVKVVALQLIKNPYFDWPTHGPWSMSTGVLQFNAGQARSGTGYAQLGGTAGVNNHAQQLLTIPSGVTTAKLVYYVKTTTAETGSGTHDKLKVQVYDGSTLLGTPDTISNRNASSDYVRRGVDMTPYIGRTITLKFFASNDATKATTFQVDDVTLKGN